MKLARIMFWDRWICDCQRGKASNSHHSCFCRVGRFLSKKKEILHSKKHLDSIDDWRKL